MKTMKFLALATLVVLAAADGEGGSKKKSAFKAGFKAGAKFGSDFKGLSKAEKKAQIDEFTGDWTEGAEFETALTDEEKENIKGCIEEFIGTQKDGDAADNVLKGGIKKMGKALVESCGDIPNVKKIFVRIVKARAKGQKTKAGRAIRKFFDGHCECDACEDGEADLLETSETCEANDPVGTWSTPRDAFKTHLETNNEAVYNKYFDETGKAKEALGAILRKIKFKRNAGDTANVLDTQDDDADADVVAIVASLTADGTDVDILSLEVASLLEADVDDADAAAFEMEADPETDPSDASSAAVFGAGVALVSLLF